MYMAVASQTAVVVSGVAVTAQYSLPLLLWHIAIKLAGKTAQHTCHTGGS